MHPWRGIPTASPPWRCPVDRSGVEQAFHPQRAEVAAVLDAVLMEGADLGEAKLAVQRDRCVVGQDDACQGNMYRFAGEAFEQRAVQRGAYPLTAAADVECDADLNGLPETFVVPVGLAGGIAQYLVAAAGDKEPVRAGQGEPLEPVPPLGHCGGLAGERGVGVRDRVVEDRHDRGKIALGPGPDLDGVRIGRGERAGPLVHVRASLPIEAWGTLASQTQVFVNPKAPYVGSSRRVSVIMQWPP